MVDAVVVDTNVLIVASAADDGSPFQPGATPVQERTLRQMVLDWLRAFEGDSSRHAVIDWDWHVCSEYQNKLSDQDYGWLALMAKRDRNEVVWVGLTIDQHGHAVLPTQLAAAVTDLADRKMVAAVLAAKDLGHNACLVNACDTDWLECADALKAFGIPVTQILEAWLIAKWTAKGKATKP